jgi:hypothetical protein
MGAWGTGIYDNDDAADWSAEVPEHGMQAVEAALDAVLEADYVEAPDGACALAAADVVARLVSGRGDDSPYCADVVGWTAANPGSPSPTVIAKAVRAVERVSGTESELAELWSENSAEVAVWRATLADVAQRLNA